MERFRGVSTVRCSEEAGIMEKLTVNGKDHPYKNGMTVAMLLCEVLDAPGTVVVERNGEIIPRGRFEDTPLNKGDIVEIVHFVGGG